MHAIMLAASLQGRRFRRPTHNVYERVCQPDTRPNVHARVMLNHGLYRRQQAVRNVETSL